MSTKSNNDSSSSDDCIIIPPKKACLNGQEKEKGSSKEDGGEAEGDNGLKSDGEREYSADEAEVPLCRPCSGNNNGDDDEEEGYYIDEDDIPVCHKCGGTPCQWTEFGDSLMEKYEELYEPSTQTSQDGEVLVVTREKSSDKVIPNNLVRKSLFRMFTKLKYTYLGSGNRVHLPPCVESKIRGIAPDVHGKYTGFFDKKTATDDDDQSKLRQVKPIKLLLFCPSRPKSERQFTSSFSLLGSAYVPVPLED